MGAYKFEIGDKVYYKSKSAKEETLVEIKNRYSTPFMNMYTLEDGSSCGEMYFRHADDDYETVDEEALFKTSRAYFGGISNMSNFFDEEEQDVPNFGAFFKPNKQFAKWLLKRFGDKLFIDVGCGDGTVTEMLVRLGGKGIGIDKFYNKTWELKRFKYRSDTSEMLHLMNEDATESTIVSAINPDTAVLLFCRPCHSTFVERTIDAAPSGTEVYYITKEENLLLYEDLGAYDKYAEKIEHEGTSVDKEVVYYFVKP